MPKAKFTPPTLGTAQPGRPNAPEQATADVQRPRALVNALAVPIDQIEPDPDQPRQNVGGARLDELAASLRSYGVLQPLLVREDGTLPDGRARYRIVAGGRRYAAALLVRADPDATDEQKARLERLPVVVKDSQGEVLRMTQLVENIQRQDLAPLEEARAFMEIMDADGITAETLAERLHISGQTVRDRVLLLSDQPMADAVQRGQIGPTVARDILRTADEPQAILRDLIDAGEVVTKTTVKEVRERATAAGVKNARAKGGGRGKRQTPPTTTQARAVPGMEDHNRYDLAASDQADEALEDALQGVDRMALARVLAYGAARQLSCERLLAMVTSNVPPTT